jgi:GT2 family glycosyltransferase/glycosyltransferase involved in cell wall biosynthesis/SAM-dependent methyltransferase
MIKKNKLIVVLGMHRSGTSAVTRGLKVLGVELGDNFLPPAADNETGFWEDLDLNKLNIELLQFISHNWHTLIPISHDELKSKKLSVFRLRAIELLREKTKSVSIFGIKDPRVPRMLPFWQEVFDQCQLDVNYVITIRNPLSVAKSLYARDNFAEEKAHYLWLAHVLPSILETVGSPRIVVDYDRLMDKPSIEITRIAQTLGLEDRINPEELWKYEREFLEERLRHTRYKPEDLILDPSAATIVSEVYETMLQVAHDTLTLDSAEVRDCLARATAHLNEIYPALRYMTHQDEQIVSLNWALSERDRQNIELGEAVTGRDEQIVNLFQTVTERDGKIASLSQVISERDRQIVELGHAAAERDQQLNNIKQVVVERDGLITRIRDNAEKLERDLTFKNKQIVALQHENTAAYRTIAALKSSYSWRLMRPLRVVGSFIKKAFSRFDAAWYLKQNPDVAMSGMNPYEHYAKFGKAEGRQPAPVLFLPFNINKEQFIIRIALRSMRRGLFGIISFCYNCLPFSPRQRKLIEEFCFKHLPLVYRGWVPSYEFWLSRRATNAPPLADIQGFAFEGVDWVLMLPAHTEKSDQGMVPHGVVDVVIPVYRGIEQTRRCINSLINAPVKTPFRLIIINDKSPEAGVREYLQTLTSFENVRVVENDENLGFVATVNRGMRYSEKNDVLLLNNDTEVANDWLDKIRTHAYSGSRVGTVTPFSNNATICNYPTLDGMRELPDRENVKSLDAAFAAANMGQNIEIPTAVGFCMYIRRDCLNEIGLFDIEAFKKGYGEENDFCLKATTRGWKHLLAADTFVYHEGEISFKEESNDRKERAMAFLRKRYPDYEKNIKKHVLKNEIYPLQVAATAARFKQSNIPKVLHILHPYGGGTEKYVNELCRNYHGKAKMLIITPPFAEQGETSLRIHSFDSVDRLDIQLPVSGLDLDFLVMLIRSFGVSLVHIHNVLGYPFNLQFLIEKIGVPFYLTVHDYTLICPRINLMPVGQNYCGEPGVSQCNKCLSSDYIRGVCDIVWWREGHSWLFNDASIVICPSHDAANRCRRYFPRALYRVVQHEIDSGECYIDINVPVLNIKEPLRIAILGVLARHKGSKLIYETLLSAEKNKAPLQFQLIGYSESEPPPVANALYSQTGFYKDDELLEKIKTFNPHLILFPACCPETYSYTLTAAMKSRRPIMVSNIGALTERVMLRPWTWLMDWNMTGTQLVDELCRLRDENFRTRTGPIPRQNNKSDGRDTIELRDFYQSEYFTACKESLIKNNFDIRKTGKITVLVLLESILEQPSPCAYIRLILPLLRERNDKIDFRWITVEQVTHYVADILICHRTAVTSIVSIDKITSHCKAHNITIIYELDDLLLALPEDHPEHVSYAPKAAAILRWLIEADEVWVSTETLRQHVCKINSYTYVIPNYLDDKLWIVKQKMEIGNERKYPVRILYMGTQTHDADFALVRNVLKTLKNEFLEKIEINIIGISSKTIGDQWCNTITPPQAVNCSYPAFVNWICNGLTFDIGIAPLSDNEFNRSKSAIKFLDYSALGLATVASDLNSYALINNGENGFRVKNTDEMWYEAIKRLINDSDLRNKIKHTARKEVFEKYGYKSVAGYRSERIKSLLSNDIGKEKNINKIVSNESVKKKEQTTIKIGRNVIASAFLTGTGIEIGALHNPLPVPNGASVRYVDRMDKPGLYQQYPELIKYRLVDVDFVDNGETLMLFKDKSEDFIIANHFLEHCEDPIGTLKAFLRVLRPGGILYCAIPNKSMTFDRDRSSTPLNHIIEDHEKGCVNSRKSHYEEWVSLVEPHFQRTYARGPVFDDRVNDLVMQHYSIHFHCWEAENFKELLYYVRDNYALSFDIILFCELDAEYVSVLRKR